MNDLPSLEVGTVVRITDILEEYLIQAVHLKIGLEGIVCFHNQLFFPTDNPLEQEGPVKPEDDMFMFECPGSRLRIGPIARMPDDHKVVAWIVGGQLYLVTNVNVLFSNNLRWFVLRTGEILRLRA